MIKYITNRTLLFLAFSLVVFGYPMDTNAQTKPGNVGIDVNLWLKADDVSGSTLSEGSSVTTWSDRSGSNNNFVQDASYDVPSYSLTSGLNYNPTLYFRNTSDAPRNLKLVSQNPFITVSGRKYYTITVSDISNATDYSNSTTYAPVFSYSGDPNTTDVETNARTGWYKSTSNYLYMGYTNNASSSLSNPGLSQRYGIVTADHTGKQFYHNGIQAGGSQNTSFAVQPKTTARAVIGKRYRAATSTANYSNGTLGNFVGKISEIIVLSTAGDLSNEDLLKIHSYLAIKYGLTLYSSVGNPAPYYTSNFNFVYNTNGSGYSTYKYGVFGIARDDASGLYQKQSKNVDDDNMTVYLGNILYPTSKENPNTISNGAYLMFGNNGVGEAVSYDKRGIAYANGVVMPEEFTHRQGLVYRAKVTSLAQPTTTGLAFPETVSLLRSGADYIMISTDENFDPASTRLYKTVSGVVTGLTITDGEYIGFLALTKSPGQISNGLRMWLRADEASTLTTEGGEVQEWRDFSGNPNNIRYWYDQSAQGSGWAFRPTFKSADASMNYHPAVYFNDRGGNDKEFLSTDRGPFDNPRPATYTFISVVNVEKYPAEADNAQTPYILGFGAKTPGTAATGDRYARRPAIGVSKRSGTNDGVARYHENTLPTFTTDNRYERYIYGTYNLFNPAATTITLHEINLYTSTGERLTDISQKYILFESDGYAEKITSSTAGMATAMNTTDGIGSKNYVDLTGPGMLGIASRRDRQLFGSIGEVIAYERGLDQDEKNIIYSYLGIKYGITLDLDKLTASTVDGSKNFDYTLSDGTIIWPGTSDLTADKKYREFHHNVAGLVRDDEGGFNNMQARSTDQNGIVRIGIGERLGENPILTGLERNLESMMWGNDGGTGETTFSIDDDDICGQMESRMNRIWMIDNTRTDNDYTITISAGGPLASGFFPYFGAGHQVYMLIADAKSDLTKTSGPYNWTIIPGSFINGEHHFSYTFEPGQDYVYFTFGGRQQAGTCDACEAAGSKVMNFTTSTWPNGYTSGTWNDLSEITPTLTISWNPVGGSRWYSRNPRAVTYNSLRMTRAGLTDGKVRMVVDLQKAAKATFTVYEIDRSGSSYETIEIYGLCGIDNVANAGEGDKFKPRLYYVDTKANSSYEILQNKATANKKTSSAFQRRGQMYVEFPYPVEKIVIDQSVSPTNKRDIMRTGLGPITFTCPIPTPPKNEDGLSFQKGAPEEVSLCDQVRYTFKIDNTNCESKVVNFIDRLDEGMEWKFVSLDTYNEVNATVRIVEQGNQSVLEITNLTVPSGDELTFFATAVFKMSETVDKTYTNRALITYTQIVNGTNTPRELESCDMYKSTFDYCSPTIVRGIATGERAEPVETTFTTSACYRERGEIKVTLTVKNPNPVAIPKTVLEFNFDDVFTYKANTIQATGALATEITDAKMIDSEEGTHGGATKTPGTFYFENLTLGANSEYTISFTMTAPTIAPTDDVTNEILPFGIEFGFESDSEDMCLSGALIDANGSADVPYCSDRMLFINQHLLHKIK